MERSGRTCARRTEGARRLARLPPILSIDHEGGRVQRLKAPLTVWPPMSVLAAQPPRVAEEVGEPWPASCRPWALTSTSRR